MLRIVLAIVLIGAGWSVGKAQTAVVDFEITVDAPRGEARVTCFRGCEWAKEGTIRFPARNREPRPLMFGARLVASEGLAAFVYRQIFSTKNTESPSQTLVGAWRGFF